MNNGKEIIHNGKIHRSIINDGIQMKANIRGKILRMFVFLCGVIHPLSVQYFSKDFNLLIDIFMSQLFEMVFFLEPHRDLKNFFSYAGADLSISLSLSIMVLFIFLVSSQRLSFL